MTERQSPWEVFFSTWSEETSHLPRVTPIPPVGAERSLAFRAMDSARERARHYAQAVLGWSKREANLATGHMALMLLDWVRIDGVDREALRARLLASEERGRAEAGLGISAEARMEERLSFQLSLV